MTDGELRAEGQDVNVGGGALESRVPALEAEVARLKERVEQGADDAAAARVLAAGADRDVSEVRAELRAHRGALNALAATQSDLQREMRAGFAAVEARFGAVDARLDSVDRRLDSVDARFDSVDARFDSVDARFDSVDARFDSVDARFKEVDVQFRAVNAQLAEVKGGITVIVGLLGGGSPGN